MRKRCVYKFQRYYITTTEPGIKRGVRYTPPLTLSAYNPTRRVFFCVGRQSQSIELRLCLMFNVQNVQRLPIPIWRVQNQLNPAAIVLKISINLNMHI